MKFEGFEGVKEFVGWPAVPDLANPFPVMGAEIPCSLFQGIRSRSGWLWGVTDLTEGKKDRIRANSLYFSLLAGKRPQETGSQLTASSSRPFGK
jgi:hypothetical protein